MSPEFVENAVADSTGDPTLVLLTIDHADMPEPMRLVCNTVDIVSRGHTYTAYPFELVLPENSDTGDTPAQLSIDNVDQRIVQIIRAISTPPTIIIEAVLGSKLDEPDLSLPPFKVYVASADRLTLQVDLTDSAEDQSESLMQYSCTPSLLPALHN